MARDPAKIGDLGAGLLGPAALAENPAGFQLRPGWPTLGEYDRWLAEVGLELEDRFATWDGQPIGADPDYAVSVHQRVVPPR